MEVVTLTILVKEYRSYLYLASSFSHLNLFLNRNLAMKKFTKSICLLLGLSASTLSYSLEGPFLSNVGPVARVSDLGQVQIFGLTGAANCFKDKAIVEPTHSQTQAVQSSMLLQVILAAQVSNKRVNVWVERYDVTSPQRCMLRHVELVN